MTDPAATLHSEPNSSQNRQNDAGPESAGQKQFGNEQPVYKAGRRILKFAYPSGSKPLEGYTIKRGIGIGGFGEVYFALSDAGKEVALKRIQRNLDIELRGVRQCLNLKHINLISLWDIRADEKGGTWVVMEYVPGQSLRDIIEAYPTGMPEPDVKNWFTSAAAGTAYLHDHGIVHRDLKPGNIFYDSDQQVIKIGDYGLSKFISCSRKSGQTESVGTFHYMAPEIGKGVYGKEIDVYAMGIILFEMLTGEVPFEGESSQEIIMKHLTADPEVGLVPEKFRKIIQRSLLKDPELRYNSVPEMLKDVPWPEVAAQSSKIVTYKTVGPVGAALKPIASTSPGKTEQSVNPQKAPEPAVAQVGKTTIRPMLMNPKQEIVFGKLNVSSAGTGKHSNHVPFAEQTPNRPPSHRLPATGGPRMHQESDPIKVVAGEAIVQSNATGALPEEPIAKAMHLSLSGVSHWWNNANISTPVKIVLLIAVAIALIYNSTWLLPAALGLGLIYLIYFMVRQWALSPSEGKERSPRVKRRAQEKAQIQVIRGWLNQRETGDRATELIGSMLIAAISCAVFNLLGMAIIGSLFQATIENWANFTWATLTAVAGCWAILACSKFWEHREGDAYFRRFTIGTLGMLVGFIAYGVANLLHVNLANLTASGYNPLKDIGLVVENVPILPAYLVFFTLLFGILRWWRQTDPSRKTRLSIWNVGLCLVWAAVFSHLLDFAPLWNCMLAVVISISIQLSAPWLHPDDRQRIQLQSAETKIDI